MFDVVAVYRSTFCFQCLVYFLAGDYRVYPHCWYIALLSSNTKSLWRWLVKWTLLWMTDIYLENVYGMLVYRLDSGHNGHKPKWPQPKRPQTGTATNRNGHRPTRPQTEMATDRNGHKPKRPQTGTATNQNGHKPERPQTGTATNRNRHNYIWFNGLQICVLNRSFKLVSRSRQK